MINKGNKRNAIMRMPLNDSELLIKLTVWNWIYLSTHFIFHQDHTAEREGHRLADRAEHQSSSVINID